MNNSQKQYHNVDNESNSISMHKASIDLWKNDTEYPNSDSQGDGYSTSSDKIKGCENTQISKNTETEEITNELEIVHVSTGDTKTKRWTANKKSQNICEIPILGRSYEGSGSKHILQQHNQTPSLLQSKLVDSSKHVNTKSDNALYKNVEESNLVTKEKEKSPKQLESEDNGGCSTKVYNTISTTSGSMESSLGDVISEVPKKSLPNACTSGIKFQPLDARPIYPNVPYSPYASPYGSPNSHRRRPPLRESRRISIESRGSFLQLNQYKLLDQIGQGSYGLVKLAYSEEDSSHYAMKILSKRRLLRQAGLMRRGPKKPITSPLDRVYREIAVLKKLDHPNVVKLIEVLDDDSNVDDSLYMVFELVKQGEVLTVPTEKPLTEERAWSVFRDTLLGLEYLHYQRIIHADLKPGNLLLTECGRVKIADLGVCNEFLGDDSTISNGSTAGTPAFRAPETLSLGKNSYCGKAADVWALGATLYALVFGKVPFLANTIPLLYERIKADDVVFPETFTVSSDLKNCIQRMLTKDPTARITIPELKENKWVTSNGMHPLPTEDENCRLVQVTDEDINSVVRSLPKLDTLILIKTMLKKHSFGNPFTKSISGRAPQRGGSRLERFVRAGRSNSAPGAYNMSENRQISCDSLLPSLAESTYSGSNKEET